MKSIAGSLAFLITAFLVSSPAQADSSLHHYRLVNGLKLVVKQDNRAPAITVQVWYRVGSSDETTGITGIAHVLEHMMFKGTKTRKTGDFSRIIANHGGIENASTAYDYTFYFEKLGSDKLSLALELEADRMQNLILDQGEFEKEIKVIREERRMRVDTQPILAAYERFGAVAHTSSPYRHMPIGWMNDLYQINLEDLKQWYQRWYSPNNATIVVVGKVNPDDVFAEVKRYFSKIPPSKLPPQRTLREPKALGKKSIEINLPAKLPWIIFGYQAPSLTTAKEDWEPYALSLLAALLGDKDNGLLVKELVRNHPIASSIDVEYEPISRYETLFTVSAIPTHKRDLAQLEQEILKRIQKLVQLPVTKSKLDRAKATLIAEHVYVQDALFYQAYLIGSIESIGSSSTQASAILEHYIDNIQRITPEQIRQVVKKYLRTKQLTVGHLNPLPTKKVSPAPTPSKLQGAFH